MRINKLSIKNLILINLSLTYWAKITSKRPTIIRKRLKSSFRSRVRNNRRKTPGKIKWQWNITKVIVVRPVIIKAKRITKVKKMVKVFLENVITKNRANHNRNRMLKVRIIKIIKYKKMSYLEVKNLKNTKCEWVFMFFLLLFKIINKIVSYRLNYCTQVLFYLK